MKMISFISKYLHVARSAVLNFSLYSSQTYNFTLYQCNSYEWKAIRCIILYLWGWSDQLLQCRHRGSRGRSRSKRCLPSLNSAVLTTYKTDRGFLISPWKVWSVISFHAAVQWYLLELERKVLAKVRNRGEGLLLVESNYYRFHIEESIKTLC